MEMIERKDLCQWCGVIVFEDGRQESSTKATSHPYWHEIEWAKCSVCTGKIWFGNSDGMNEKFPSREIKWGGWYDGTFEKNNLRCEHCGLKEE